METPPRSIAQCLELVEGLARIQAKYHLDSIIVGDVHLARTEHEPFPDTPRAAGDDTSGGDGDHEDDGDESLTPEERERRKLMFHSSGG